MSELLDQPDPFPFLQKKLVLEFLVLCPKDLSLVIELLGLVGRGIELCHGLKYIWKKESYKFSLNFIEKWNRNNEKTTYLEQIMDGRVFKVSHWYVETCTHLSVKDNPFERLPGMIFVQYQVRRMFGWNWRMNLMRNYGCRGNRSFGLDDWRRDLRGHQFHCWVVRVYCCVLRLWNFGMSDFVRFLLLKTSASWKTSKIYVAWNAFPLPSSSLNSKLLDGQWS